jgi:DNA-binding protein YbaB
VKAVSIEKSLVDPNDVEILEDLLVVAFNNATDQFNKAKESLMSDATGGVKLPF